WDGQYDELPCASAIDRSGDAVVPGQFGTSTDPGPEPPSGGLATPAPSRPSIRVRAGVSVVSEVSLPPGLTGDLASRPTPKRAASLRRADSWPLPCVFKARPFAADVAFPFPI